MKLLMRKCQICDTWNHASRQHCYYCGATPIYFPPLRTFKHFDCVTTVQMVRGTIAVDSLTGKAVAASRVL